MVSYCNVDYVKCMSIIIKKLKRKKKANWELAILWVRNIPVEDEEYKWTFIYSLILNLSQKNKNLFEWKIFQQQCILCH